MGGEDVSQAVVNLKTSHLLCEAVGALSSSFINHQQTATPAVSVTTGPLLRQQSDILTEHTITLLLSLSPPTTYNIKAT